MQVDLISITANAEKVIEKAGRTAYLSFDKETDHPIIQGKAGKSTRVFRVEEYPELISVKMNKEFSVNNKEWKVNKVWRNSAEKFVEMIVRSGHFSVLEHVSATFRIRGGSRAFTHQLVRHRMAAFTQQSQRYVDEETFQYIEPPSIVENPQAHTIFLNFMERARKVYHQLQEIGIRNEDARFVLPNSVESEIVITANLREWRHLVETRGSLKAQWEIRKVVLEILRILKKNVQSAFYDLEINEEKGIIRRLKE